LTSIRGYAELLRKGAFDTEDDRRRAAERIEGEAARMSVLVDDLLLLARLDQGRPLDRGPVDLCRVAADAVETARVNDGQQAVTLEADAPVVVLGDAGRLRQIVDNLLHNAAVHTPPGTPVHVRVMRQGKMAVIQVADEGPGLDAEQAARVFDRFYRGSKARTGEGTGLGLSIVAALADAHGGATRVDTAPGAGAVFTVEIPAADPDADTDPDGEPGLSRAPWPVQESADPSAAPTASPGGGDEHLAPSVRR
jgi:two-component system OmpR family sensor kinase